MTRPPRVIIPEVPPLRRWTYRVEMVSHSTGEVTLILKTGVRFSEAIELRDKHANDGRAFARMVLEAVTSEQPAVESAESKTETPTPTETKP